jgi:hypothetical protein
MVWAYGTREKDQISLAGTGQWIVVVWEEGGKQGRFIKGIWQRGKLRGAGGGGFHGFVQRWQTAC